MLLFCVTIVHGGSVEFALDNNYYQITDGHIRLEWQSETGNTFELQQSFTRDFSHPKVIYLGPDRASFISGLQNGSYYYRVRASDGEWSEVVIVDVQHQSLKLAFALFGIGGVVFLVTVYVVVHGVRSTSAHSQ